MAAVVCAGTHLVRGSSPSSARLPAARSFAPAFRRGVQVFSSQTDVGKVQNAPVEKMQTPLPPGVEGALPVTDESIVYKRYLTVFNRTVRYPPAAEGDEGKLVDFDIVGHPRSDFKFTVAFPFHPSADRGGTVTVIKEFSQGLNTMCYCLPTGGFDPNKHQSMQKCAAAELSEEAHLCGGQYVRLIPEEHPGIPESKWCLNRFVPFLVISPETDATPGKRDEEEIIEVTKVSIPELKKLMYSGDMQPPSIVTCGAALEELERRGLL